MNNYKKLCLTLLLALLGFGVAAQGGIQLKGKVMDSYTNAPVENAIVGALGSVSVNTDANGEFILSVESLKGLLNVWAPGYYTQELPILGRTYIEVVLVGEDKMGYQEYMQVPFTGDVARSSRVTSSFSLEKKDIAPYLTQVENTLFNIPGVRVIEKSGMPGEGAFINIRGINSVNATTAPLIVINDVPQRMDLNISPVINGYSRSILGAVNPQDIQNITLLRGAEAAIYGSMASNGVLLIETERALEMDTKIEYTGQFGVNMKRQDMPLLNVDEYKAYMASAAKSRWGSSAEVIRYVPYLAENPESPDYQLYNNDTDWQKEIYRIGFLTDHTLKIEGGDQIAKYDLTVGYNGNAGYVESTKLDKYYVRMNSDVALHQKLTLATNFSTMYTNSTLAEQGMTVETSPLFAAYRKGPIFSPYVKDIDGNLSPRLATATTDGNGNNNVSNPLAVVNDISTEAKAYDIQANMKLRYNVNDKIALTGIVGLYYYYTSESIFIPGKSYRTIMPINVGFNADNTVRAGVSRTLNMYYAVNGSYKTTFNRVHNLTVALGAQASVNTSEYDAGEGYNTTNDDFRQLGNVQTDGRHFFGYNDKWNWLNFNASVGYMYDNVAGLNFVLAADRASSTGKDAQLYGIYPGVNAALYLKNTPWFRDVKAVNNLTLRGEFSSTGNSQYATELSKYSYIGERFATITGIVRPGVPNTWLKPEVNDTWNVGLDFSLFNNRLDVRADYYDSKVRDLILQKQISVAFGTSFMYENMGELSNKGYELGLQYAVLNRKDYSWYIGGTIASNRNKMVSLGGNENIVTTLSDGSQLIVAEGEALNSFYGYQTDGIFNTLGASDIAQLTNDQGRRFGAGDVKFVDQNGDKVINNDDRVILGNANPDFFGTFYTNFRYKAFELSAMFTYSSGNKAYNATRRRMETMGDFGNQFRSVASRWTMEGQQTNMPRATYGDPMQNARFSDRFIEDASYIKLKQVMVSYTFPVINGLTVYLAGENLFTFTDYLGIDPEYMYSYDAAMMGVDYAKIALARTVKLGLKIQF